MTTPILNACMPAMSGTPVGSNDVFPRPHTQLELLLYTFPPPQAVCHMFYLFKVISYTLVGGVEDFCLNLNILSRFIDSKLFVIILKNGFVTAHPDATKVSSSAKVDC